MMHDIANEYIAQLGFHPSSPNQNGMVQTFGSSSCFNRAVWVKKAIVVLVMKCINFILYI
jgi:hypothetical protein